MSNDAPADRKVLVDRLGLTFPVVSDPERDIIREFGLVEDGDGDCSLPALYVVDAAGVIRFAKVGSNIVDRATSADVVRALSSVAKPAH